MDAIGFAFTVVLITASGALAPGPLFVATFSHGTRSGVRSGLMFALAHMVVEFSLIMLLALGLLSVSNQPIVRVVIGSAGGVVLIGFGVFQVYDAFRKTKGGGDESVLPSNRRLFLLGITFSALNPYFIMWWLTVGSQLILIALEFAAFVGVLFMYVCHVWMDYTWLGVVSYFAKKGKNVMGSRFYRPLIGVFGLVLIYFGISFIYGVFSIN